MHIKIGIIGMGYVGLPLARLFATKYDVIGFDIDSHRINSLNNGVDVTLEISSKQLKAVLKLNNDGKTGLFCTVDSQELANCNIYIVTVPTPVDAKNVPVLTPLLNASKSIATFLKPNDIVIYESTVFPGATEDICVPILESISELTYNADFFVGYSPERINPGDKNHTVEKILKVTSGSTPAVAHRIDQLYSSVITAGTHLAPSIKVAEAAKIIENSQRDINIAFVNELAKIFNKLDIDTHAVLEAAGTKWNFLPFKPGLVGGHCIGVDPYYLAQKAQEVGYHPEIILAGRRMNDSMGSYVAGEVVKLMLHKGIAITGAKALILGITFKENCPDVRNTKVIDVIQNLKEYGIDVKVWDPLANKKEVNHQYGLIIHNKIPEEEYDVLVLTVAHYQFLEVDLNKLKKTIAVVYDVKGVLGNKADKRL